MKKLLMLTCIMIFGLTGCGKASKVAEDADHYYASLTSEIDSNQVIIDSFMDDQTLSIKNQDTKALFELFLKLWYGFDSIDEANEAINEMRVDYARSTKYKVGDVTKNDDGTYNVHMYFQPVYSGNYVFDAYKYQLQLYINMLSVFFPEKNDIELKKLADKVMNNSFSMNVIKVGDNVYTININQYKMAVSQMIYYDEWLDLGSLNSDIWYEEEIQFENVNGTFVPSTDVGINYTTDNPQFYKDYYFVSSQTQNNYIANNPELFDANGNYIGELPADKK